MALKVSFLKDDNSRPKMFIDKGSQFTNSVYLPLSNDMSFVTFYSTFDSSSVYFKEINISHIFDSLWMSFFNIILLCVEMGFVAIDAE